MTSLSQTALEFVRDVLGWEDARITGGREWIGYNWQVDPIDPAESGCALFDYGDLNAVMKAVRDWCDSKGCEIELRYFSDQGGYGVLCEGVDTWNENPCHALLGACVEADRKLRSA